MSNTPQKTTRGGAGRGQGRKALAAETVRYSLLMTPEQRARLEQLGGAAWLREQIDKAGCDAP